RDSTRDDLYVPAKFGLEKKTRGTAWGRRLGVVHSSLEGEEPTAWGRPFEPRVEPWLGIEPRLDGLAWLGCGSHSVERKAGKCLKLN
ncbi:hypothetical protein CRG98_049374, partial [Punica granatum]